MMSKMETPCEKCSSEKSKTSKQSKKKGSSAKLVKTDLMQAAKLGHVKCVDALIKDGADVDAVDENFSTALMRAADRGRTECIELLIKAGADVNLWNAAGQTALTAAAHAGSVGSVKALLEAGAEVNLSRGAQRSNYSALYYAAAIGDRAVVDLLIKAGADVNKEEQGDSILEIASENVGLSEYDECFKLLLQAGADVNKGGSIFNMVNDEGKLRCLIEAGAHVNQMKWNFSTPLMHAAARGNPESVKLLIDGGADVSACGMHGTALIYAATGSLDFLDNELTAPSEIDWIAPETEKCAALLLEAGADVNQRADSGETPLMRAAFAANVNCLEVLIEKGADVNLTDKSGRTALMHAAWALEAIRDGSMRAKKQEEKQRISKDIFSCVKLLLEAGADTNAISKHGLTALGGLEKFIDSAKEDSHHLYADIYKILRATGDKPGPGPAENEKLSLRNMTREEIREQMMRCKSRSQDTKKIKFGDTEKTQLEVTNKREPENPEKTELGDSEKADLGDTEKTELVDTEKTELRDTKKVNLRSGGKKSALLFGQVNVPWDGPNDDDTDDDSDDDDGWDDYLQLREKFPKLFQPFLGEASLKKHFKSHQAQAKKKCHFYLYGDGSDIHDNATDDNEKAKVCIDGITTTERRELNSDTDLKSKLQSDNDFDIYRLSAEDVRFSLSQPYIRTAEDEAMELAAFIKSEYEDAEFFRDPKHWLDVPLWDENEENGLSRFDKICIMVDRAWGKLHRMHHMEQKSELTDAAKCHMEQLEEMAQSLLHAVDVVENDQDEVARTDTSREAEETSPS